MSLSIRILRFIHVIVYYQNFILFLGWIIFYYMYILYFANPFNYSLVVSIFWLLCIMLPWTVTEYNDLLEFLLLILLDTYLEVELLDHTKILCITLRNHHIAFQSCTIPFHNPTTNAQGFQFIYSSPTLFSVCLFFFFFYNGHPNGYEVVSYGGFDLHFIND